MKQGVVTNEARVRLPALPVPQPSRETKVKVTKVKDKVKREQNHAKLMQDFADLGKFAANLNLQIQDDIDKVDDTLSELKRLDAEKLVHIIIHNISLYLCMYIVKLSN